jgi:hypothetical protein
MTGGDVVEKEIGDARVVYVPGARNRYVPYADTVVLDEGIREYPLAHRHILKHELMHHKIGDDILPSLWHEFRADAIHYALRGETSKEIREYYSDKDERRPSKKAGVVAAFRPVFGVPIASFGILRHTVLDPLADVRDRVRKALEVDVEEVDML